MKLLVDLQDLEGHLHSIDVLDGGTKIGEYERAELQTVERKLAEIASARDFLRDVFRQHGAFVVRWDQASQSKSVRVNDVEVARLPEELWKHLA